jgi:hypothetical protein
VTSLKWILVSVHLEIGELFVSTVSQAQKSFGMYPMVLLGDEAQVEARFSLFGDSANLHAR